MTDGLAGLPQPAFKVTTVAARRDFRNALLVGEKRKRISKELVRTFLDELVALPIVLEQLPTGFVFDRVQHLSRKHGLIPCNATYLDLALNSRFPLATLDEDLRRACEKARVRLVQG